MCARKVLQNSWKSWRAGERTRTADLLIMNEQVTGLVKFSPAWLRSQGLIASRCRIMRVRANRWSRRCRTAAESS